MIRGLSRQRGRSEPPDCLRMFKLTRMRDVSAARQQQDLSSSTYRTLSPSGGEEMAALLDDVVPETKLLLAIDIDVRPLRYSELPRAVKCSRDAIASDSLTRYLAGGDHSPGVYKLRETVLTTLSFATSIRTRRILTIDHGDAICGYRLPEDKPSKMLLLLARLSKAMGAKEYAKRSTEVRDAISELLETSLGDRIADMIEIQSLATSPKQQGRGYGTALVEAVVSLADEQGRAVFLVTTDAYRFYEFVGFKLVRERLVGVDNPTWDGAPVAIRIMLKEPHDIKREREKKQ
ncbi:hypothetical protein LXA43DRAFT_324646 [Ganoderma leucocontextum]|nr:hypothetical protein LXA43DRAFT_324646 [Ganoderma leucocontextum]